MNLFKSELGLKHWWTKSKCKFLSSGFVSGAVIAAVVPIKISPEPASQNPLFKTNIKKKLYCWVIIFTHQLKPPHTRNLKTFNFASRCIRHFSLIYDYSFPYLGFAATILFSFLFGVGFLVYGSFGNNLAVYSFFLALLLCFSCSR